MERERLPEQLDRPQRAAIALCGSAAEAEDLVQETFARVLGRGVPGGDPLAYLLRTLRNTYLAGLRTARRRPRTAELGEELASPLAQPDVALEQREALGAIATLRDDRRRALVAVDIVGLSYREAAHALGTPEATLTTRLFRARRQSCAR